MLAGSYVSQISKQNIAPPVPSLKITIGANTSIGNSCSLTVPVIFDTGASKSVVPYTALRAICQTLKLDGLPYRSAIAHDFNGGQHDVLIYELCVVGPASLTDSGIVEFIALERSFGLLGRDILNRYFVELNGPSLSWRIEHRRRSWLRCLLASIARPFRRMK